MIKSFFTDIFQYDRFPTEYECFKRLGSLGLNYIAVPWTQILNSSWMEFPGRMPTERYFNEIMGYEVSGTNNFTVCQHDSYMRIESILKELNVTKLFCISHDIRDKMEGIEIVPLAFAFKFEFNSVPKDILFSFVGSYKSHEIRGRMRERVVGENVVYRDEFHGANLFADMSREECEYKEKLERSRFSLCPRGSAPSSIRFWESLGAGSIPVLVSDYWHLPLWNWEDTIVRINESDFENMDYDDIKEFLKSIPLERELIMRKNCLLANEEFKKENFANYISSNLGLR
jgi:hypothetical protein